ncbi:MAG: ABC transporter substrate-binding protein [Anaerolineales bacterium]|nr:ABC transporter substrate-binding protein [Anaerolineales bacterium]
MKTFAKVLTLVILFSLLAGCGGAAPTAAPEQPAENTESQAVEAPAEAAPVEEAPALSPKEEWLKANQLGPYTTDTQDWAAIEEAAKKEGKVVVYANSSKIAKAMEIWTEMYPDIVIEGYDLGGDDVLSKTVGEQQSGTIVGDVWFSSGGAEIVGNVLPNEYVWRFVPDTASVAPEFSEPLLMSRLGTTILAYNSELNEACPVTNIWEVTQPEWKGKFVIEDPLNDASTLSKLLTFVYYAEEMKQAYVDLYGSEPVLDADTPDAGWLWLKRFAQNGPIPQPGGDEVDSAFATPGMTENYLAFTSYSNYPDVQDGNLAFEPCWGVKPMSGVQSQSYLGIMNQAPHPNAAKLFIKFIISEAGRDPWAKFGTFFPDPTYVVPEGMLTIDEVMKVTWLIPEQFAYDNLVQARDFYLLNLGKP